jgi:ribosomal-protein-alanine N-acetyltransferase
MVMDDIPHVMVIERASFPTPWSEEVFVNDLTENANSQYIVGIMDGRIVAYGGIWIFGEIGHITTIAVLPELRGRGLGDETLVAVIDLGRQAGVEKFTLEVRANNKLAIQMYEKYGFKRIGIRKNYYKEEHEDAVVMWTGDPPYEG